MSKGAVVEQPVGFAEVAVVPEPVLSSHDGIEIMLGALVVRLPKSTPSKRVIESKRRSNRNSWWPTATLLRLCEYRRGGSLWSGTDRRSRGRQWCPLYC